MDLQILQKENNKIIFLLKGIDYTYANTIRRTMLSRVPSLAIKEIYFTKNSSALFNEMIAHRLGLIPLLTDLQSYELQENYFTERLASHHCADQGESVGHGLGHG